MRNDDLELIYREYLSKYKAEKIKGFKASDLRGLIRDTAKEAKQNYHNLEEPRTCKLNVYTDFWVRQVVSRDFAKKAAKNISFNDSPTSFRASVEYYSLFPYEMHSELRRRLFNTKLTERSGVWESFHLPVKKIEENFKKMATERIGFARRKGYETYIDMHLDIYGIQQSDYQEFISKADKILEYVNQQLPKVNKKPSQFYSIFNLPCFVCELPSFPFKAHSEVVNFVAKNNKLLDKFKQRIVIKEGEISEMVYKKKTDSFEIILDQDDNHRHKILDLIHELGHVILYLQYFSKDVNPLKKSVCRREKEVFKIELSNLKRMSRSLYHAMLGTEIPLLFKRILFEIELYTNPKQNLSKLYAKTFNRCFKKAKQKENPLYLLDREVVLAPFLSLPHTIACATVLSGLIKAQN